MGTEIWPGLCSARPGMGASTWKERLPYLIGTKAPHGLQSQADLDLNPDSVIY